MLTLTRKKNEAIIIGGDIEIRILGIQGEKVKIGINAPKECSIYRGELYKQISQENKEAVQTLEVNASELEALFDVK